MNFSKEHRFVFLLPWKTASSTAYARLQPYNDSPYERFYDYNPYLLRVVHQHLCYSDYLRLPESLLNFRTGAFVRNPYDRVYSAFVQMQRDIQTQPHQQFAKAWVKELVMKQLSENFSQLAAADFDFNTWFLSVKGLSDLRNWQKLKFSLASCALLDRFIWTQKGRFYREGGDF